MKYKRKGDRFYSTAHSFWHSQTSVTSSWTETIEEKILAEKVTHYYLDLQGSQHGDWTKLFQLVFQCNPFLMNLLSCTKQREEKQKKQRHHFLGSFPTSSDIKKTLTTGPTKIEVSYGSRMSELEDNHVYSWWLDKGSFTFCNFSAPSWRLWNENDWLTTANPPLPPQSHLQF